MMLLTLPILFFNAVTAAAPLSSAAHASMRAGDLVSSIGGGSRSDANWIDLMTAPEAAATVPGLKLLASIWDRTGLTFKIEQSRHLTLLMPTDTAMNRLNQALPCLAYDEADLLLKSLLIPEVFKASERADGDYPFTTAAGIDVIFRVERSSEASGEPAIIQLTGPGALPVNAADYPRAVPATLKVVWNDKIVAQGDAHFLDTANGVGYLIDALPVLSSEVEKSLEAAVRECAKRVPAKATKAAPTRNTVPWHIEKTSQQHAAWGRYERDSNSSSVGFFDETAATQNDSLELQQHNLRGSVRNEKPSKPPVVVGVIQQRRKPDMSGVLGRRM